MYIYDKRLIKIFKYFCIFLFIYCLHLEACDWIDPPKIDYSQILDVNNEETSNLTSLVYFYHQIPKDRIKERVSQLQMIDSYLKDLDKNPNFHAKNSTLLILKKLILNKIDYLIALSKISSESEIKFYHEDISELTDSQYMPLFLRNQRTYSLKMKEFWGQFWLEFVDPCHRRLADYYQFWLNTSPKPIDYLSFFIWLEDQLIPKFIPKIIFYNDLEIKKCRITISNGYLMNEDGDLVNTFNKVRNLFVIDLKQDFFVEAWREGIWHTTLSRGRPVLGAGLVHIEEGVIKRFCCESGHYLPNLDQSYQALTILKKKEALFNSPLEFIYFENKSKYRVFIFIETLKTFEDFNKAIHHKSRELLSNDEF